MPARTPVFMCLVWLTGTLTATGVGIVAVQRVALSVSDQGSDALSMGDVQKALAAVPVKALPSSAARVQPGRGQGRPSPQPTRAASVALGAVRTLTTTGGRVVAQCQEGAVTVIYATPETGYRTDRTTRSDGVVFHFTSVERAVDISLTCDDSGLRSDVSSRPTRQPPAPQRPDVNPSPTYTEFPEAGWHESPEPRPDPEAPEDRGIVDRESAAP